MDYYEITPPTPRPYQIDLLNRSRAGAAQQGPPIRLLVQGETGSGKSIFASTMICRAYDKGKRSLFIARGRTLVNQFAKHLYNCNLPVGIIMAEHDHGVRDSPVQVASKDTLSSRFLRNHWIGLPDFDLVIIDEAHERGREWLELIARFNLVIGLTATPALPNGDGLGEPWKGLVCCESSQSLIAQGYLVPTRVFAPFVPDLKGVRKDSETGEYVAKQLAKRMDRPSLVGDIVSNWKKFAEGRPTIAFGCTIEHAKHIRDEFLKAGIRTQHIDQTTSDGERESIFDSTTQGTNLVITNVAVMTRGVDLPCLSCAILARPMASFTLFRQTIGRIKRPFQGKTDAIVIDHAGAVYRHGLPDEDVEWELGTAKNVQQKIEKERKEGIRDNPICCPECFAMFSGQKTCPNCGFLCTSASSTRKVKMANGILIEVGDVGDAAKQEAKDRYWKKCLFVMSHRKQTFLAARAMYKQKYKEWPTCKLMPDYELWSKPITEVFPWTQKAKVY